MSASSFELKWKRLHPNATLPKYGTAEAACFDLSAALDAEMTLEPGQIVAIPTGWACEFPAGFEMQVRARSGLAAKFGFTLVNGVGTIDSDYRGEIRVLATLLGRVPLVIRNGDRIAQALIAPVLRVHHVLVSELSNSERGEKGFGSTGVSS
jgi:dUTP pyrophosphatase